MRQGLSRRTLGRSALAVAGTFGILRHARGEQALKIRCSMDTAPSHVRNVSVVDYLKKVEDATGGKVTSEVFHSGQLYADLNVAKALLQGQVDMAAPGDWTQTGIVPDADFCQLPVFYGQPIEATEKASDGKPGALIVRQIETKLRVKVLGPWLDLGFQNWYTTKKQLNTTGDIKGLKIRSPGGAGISWRIAFFGGIPNVTAWPNVPLALSQGTFDGFVFDQRKRGHGQVVGSRGQVFVSGSPVCRSVHADDKRDLLGQADAGHPEDHGRSLDGERRCLPCQRRGVTGSGPQDDGGERRHLRRSVAGCVEQRA